MAWIQRLGLLRSPVSTYANLPLSSNVLGDVRLATDTGDAYTWMLEATSGSLTDWKKVTTSDYNDLVGAPVSTGLDVDNAVKTVVGMAINIAYLGFQVLAEYLASVARMFDGIIDRFADEAGIQSSTDALYSGYLSNHENIKYYLPNKGDLDIQTKLLLHGDGNQGSTSFLDLLRTKFVNYGVITDTSVKKFGTGSLKFDGVNDYIEFKDSDDSNFVNNLLYNFNLSYNPNSIAIDFWFNSNASGIQPIMSNGVISNLPSLTDISYDNGKLLLITKNSSNKIEVQIQHGDWDGNLGQPADAPLTVESTTVLSNSTWYHVAIQKNLSGYIELYINGVLEATSSAFNVGPALYPWPAPALYIGKNGSTYLNGYLDEIRVSFAVRYTTSFTPMTKAYNTATTPAPTPVIEDISAGAKTVTVHGNARMSGNNPLFGNASLYLDGINSYLSLADSDDWMLTEDLGLLEIDSYTKLLLHLDNNVTDSELTPKTVTNNNVTFSTSSKFGTHSASFNGSNAYLSIPDSDDFAFGTGDFTIDFWFYHISSAGGQAFITQRVDANNRFRLLLASNGRIYFVNQYEENYLADYLSASCLTLDSWNHIALVRTGANLYLFINGISQTWASITAEITSGTSLPNLSADVEIGREQVANYYLNGKLDEVRVSKGIARWTSDFTPPTNAYGETVLLSDYTVDLWIDPLSLTDLDTYIIGQEDSWKLTLDGTSNKYLKYTIVGGNYVIAPISLSLETWQHVAIVQKDSVVKLYVNGILGASIAGTAIVNGTELLTIGADSNGEHLFNGFIEEVRISDNARWSAAFTPPSVEYSSDSNTKLLLPLNVQTVPNMVLQSVGYVSNYVPTSARVVIFEEDIDVMEPNVDLVIEISRDGGTTFTTCLIAKDQEFGDGTLNLFTGSVDLDAQPHGELLVWKLTTQNNKDCRIRGISLSWR